ncbi:hypothetical protein ISREJYDI_CDS0052 [Pseudomonas phage UNO-G1W1]|uniref:dATP/dGTP diphosphohydrolase N-terminal domain-containing protein n=1 Tax=Pseudomonas phage UNO-G1W1 TaxID=3136609 RepID=A0AAX4MVC5_9CAUD
MSVRALTIEEMMRQVEREPAVLIQPFHGQPAGTPLVRVRKLLDGRDSVAYKYGPNLESWDFFEEGTVGVVEASTNTVCAGRLCVDFSKHMELFQPELVAPGTEVPMGTESFGKEPLGVYRPELETRKVGKVRVELVDHGFPLALREVAKVMTWAQDAKGYKDHDWQNLPNAEVALEAAASRHRTDHINQRVVEGYLIERCVDHESGLLHKAHEAFGVLAQLELMLRGEFDMGVDMPR